MSKHTRSNPHSWELWNRWAQEAVKPSEWLRNLQATGEVSSYPEIDAMQDVPQDPTWHPEGDVFVHTYHVVDAAADICVRERLDSVARDLLIFCALTHDFGKPKATFMKNGRWTSPKHGMYSTGLAKQFLRQIGHPGMEGHSGGYLYEKLEKLVLEHLSYVNVTTDKSLLHLAERLKPASLKELLWLIEADNSGRPPLPKALPDIAKKMKQRSIELGVYEAGPKPFITGDLLIRHNLLEPGPQMGVFLNQAFASQLNGDFLNEAEALKWARGQLFKPLLNGKIIIDSGILPSCSKVGKLLDAARLAQHEGVFSDLEAAKSWAKVWVKGN